MIFCLSFFFAPPLIFWTWERQIRCNGKQANKNNGQVPKGGCPLAAIPIVFFDRLPYLHLSFIHGSKNKWWGKNPRQLAGGYGLVMLQIGGALIC